VSGRDFLTAIVVGAELFCRLGLACPNNLAKGWHPTTGFGCFAAAATVGKILHLDSEQMMQALALAYVQMSGNTQSITDGALSKRLGPGFAARNGLTAAYLARSGLTGPWRFLEGKAGLFAQYEDRGGAPDQLLEEFGAQWRLTELSMSPTLAADALTRSSISALIFTKKESIRRKSTTAHSISAQRTTKSSVLLSIPGTTTRSSMRSSMLAIPLRERSRMAVSTLQALHLTRCGRTHRPQRNSVAR
jgi:hypothetical protein